MHTVNIHEAKTHLSRLVDRAVKAESFIIARSGKPMVKVVAIDAPAAGEMRRVGFMAGQFFQFQTRLIAWPMRKSGSCLAATHETSARCPSFALGGGRARRAPAPRAGDCGPSVRWGVEVSYRLRPPMNAFTRAESTWFHQTPSCFSALAMMTPSTMARISLALSGVTPLPTNVGRPAACLIMLM